MEIRVQLVEAGSFLKQCGSWGSSSWPKAQQGPLPAETSHWFHAFSFDLAPLQVVPPYEATAPTVLPQHWSIQMLPQKPARPLQSPSSQHTIFFTALPAFWSHFIYALNGLLSGLNETQG